MVRIPGFSELDHHVRIAVGLSSYGFVPGTGGSGSRGKLRSTLSISIYTPNGVFLFFCLFMAGIPYARPDLHSLDYVGSDSPDSGQFSQYEAGVHDLFNLLIYITEVASTSSDIASGHSFMADITSWCSQQSLNHTLVNIACVFWFASTRTANIDQ